MQNITVKRMLQESEVTGYLGIGRTKARELCKDIGATVHLGRRVLYDRMKIDEYLDSLTKGNSK